MILLNKQDYNDYSDVRLLFVMEKFIRVDVFGFPKIFLEFMF